MSWGGTAGSKPAARRSYLAAWASDDPEVVRERLEPISRTVEELIEVLEV